jgi:ADP-dependent NAD(P)H-hydrate dehydratase / NAD(P)H-hydrate epimerase
MNTLGLTQHINSQALWPLHNAESTQRLERQAKAILPFHTLMQRAGLATAQLAMAIAPHARIVWIACGPGNNGGDGLEAAIHLQAWGKQAVVTWLKDATDLPADARHAWHRAQAAGVALCEHPPKKFDLAIDALLGIGATRPPQDVMAKWLRIMQTSTAPVLCVDMPTGLLADTGEWLGAPHTYLANSQVHTLSLLTLKPGLFTSDGRDASGQVWFNNLGVDTISDATAWLQQRLAVQGPRPHNSHKGSFGEVSIIGGARGMSGAAMLAGLAALQGGAGRVRLGLMDTAAQHVVTAAHPALMVCQPTDLALDTSTVVCGCGAGDAIHALLHQVLSSSKRLVLDADALNAIAQDTALQRLLNQRYSRRQPTVMTPHPLEAARLLTSNTHDIQHNRLHAAQELADKFQCVVVLKGSGSVIAQSQRPPVINGSGNALLATAGTGDVLAGLIGAYITRHTDTFEATCQAVFAHGHAASVWPIEAPALNAAGLAAAVR